MPEAGHERKVAFHLKCDFCQRPGVYDARTKMGPWANLCEDHFKRYGVGTGYGRGQRLVVER